jgi:hypothetical protein
MTVDPGLTNFYFSPACSVLSYGRLFLYLAQFIFILLLPQPWHAI